MKTRYIDVTTMKNLIQVEGIPTIISHLVQTMREDFARWPDFDKSPRTANHSELGVIELMPISDSKQFSFKYVNGHPKNGLRHLPTVMAFGVLSEVETGLPILVSEMTLLTALRTAATSVMAASVLARKDARTMAVIGNGAQSEFQILAFHHSLGIKNFRLFDTDSEATEKLLRNLSNYPGIHLEAFKSTAEAVLGSDVVTTSTADKAYATILTRDMIEPGMHLNAIGGDCPGKTELEASILEAASVFVEFPPQTRIEGEIQQMSPDFAVTELWQVLNGQKPGRTSDSEITVFDSVGFALEDYSALRYIDKVCRERNLGVEMDMIPNMSDPKDLFGLLPSAKLSLSSAS